MKNTKLKNLITEANQADKDNMKSMMKELDDLFANMDWTYRMSDDFRVWKSGERAWDRIYDLTKALIKSGYKIPTQKIWNKYYSKYKSWFPYKFEDFV